MGKTFIIKWRNPDGTINCKEYKSFRSCVDVMKRLLLKKTEFQVIYR